MPDDKDAHNDVNRTAPLVHIGGGQFRRVDPGETESLHRRHAEEQHEHDAQKRRPSRHTLQGLVCRPANEAELREAVEQAFAYRGDVSLLLDDESIVTGFLFDRRSAEELAQCVARIIPARWKADPQERLSVPYERIRAIMFSGRDAAGGLAWEVWRDKQRLTDTDSDRGCD